MFLSSFSCPRCKSRDVHRSHRRGMDWLLSGMGFRPIKCLSCDHRFYVRYSVVKGLEHPEAEVE